MNSKEIAQIIEQHSYQDIATQAELLETHISWIILTKNFAFKIKKPIQYSFLSFSNLEKRKYYCEREVFLNRRLTKDIYLDVVPIRKYQNTCMIEGQKGEVVDYAVKMKRLDTSKRMDLLLQKGLVTEDHMIQLGEVLAHFHASTNKIKEDIFVYDLVLDFADLLKVKSFISENIGKEEGHLIEQITGFVKTFLKKNKTRILERHEQGFTVDGHGDLHSRNIFLLDQPVIFDCIEFNDHFRHIDVLNELAFFCMDLDYFQKPNLQIHFLNAYMKINPCIQSDVDQLLFQYYKLYRANVRTKVKALKAMQEKNSEAFSKRLKECREYFELMKKYYSLLKSMTSKRNDSDN